MAVLGQSSLGTMRMNAARLNYHQAPAYLTVAGVDRSTKLRREGLHVQETVNSSPNTASFRVSGFAPVVGQEVKLYCGSTAVTELMFAGTILRVTQIREGAPRNVAYDLECIDYTGLLDRRLVFKTYTNVSASTIAADLVTTDASGFTAANVQPSLPLVSVTFIGVSRTQALTTLAQLVGAHWKVSYTKDLRFATTATTSLPDPDTLTNANVLAGDHDFAALSDGSQLRTRVYVVGKGTTAIAAAAIGDALLAVQDATLFPTGTAVVGGQRISYTGVSAAFTGSIVGPGAGPTAAPSAILNSTASSLLTDVDYLYAVSFVTGAGETTPGPTITTRPRSTSLPTPTETPTFYSNTAIPGGLTPGGSYQYKLTAQVDSSGETQPGPASAVISPTGTSVQISWQIVLAPGTRYVILHRTTNGGATFKRVQVFDLTQTVLSIVMNGGTWGYGGYIDSLADGSLGADAPSTNTATRGAVNLFSIALGGATVTQRKVWRTAGNGTQLKLLTTLANNTTTLFLDTLADASLGANAPVTDTSGLTMPTGQVAAGSTSLRVAGTGLFSSTGGWALVGGMSVKYAGTDSQNLTGIPAAGIGALTSTVTYGTAIVIPPMLTGIPPSGSLSIGALVNVGEPVRPYVQRDDLAAQAIIAAAEGGDGIHEDLIDDDTLVNTAAMNAAGDAALTLFKAVEARRTFCGRDYKLQTGATGTFNMAAPTSLSGSALIQSVSITQIGIRGAAAPFLYPLRTVEMGTSRLTLPEFLRQVATQ